METGPLSVRRAGVLLHITSLPGGDVGEDAFRFVDFLADAGATVWQVLPLAPTHEADRSPYNALSAMAGNPELISPARQAARGMTEVAGLTGDRRLEFEQWSLEQAEWLDPYVEFSALRGLLDGAPWPTWPAGLRDRDPRVVAEALAAHRDTLEEIRFEQWVFAEQWRELRSYAASRGVLLFGDLPIFVSHDSADVWAGRDLFELDGQGQPVTVTGVPPDYFAEDGQRWNNPHYDWARMTEDGFGWWRRRISRQRELFDLVRIDHFRGFQAAWHVPLEAATAKEGHWVTNPGEAVLSALVEAAGPGTLVAEDLGLITPEVERLRDHFGLPGMRVLQFAFDGDPANLHLPAHHPELSVAYTGTHDNDTTLGWWESLDETTRDLVRRTLRDVDDPMPWGLIRAAVASSALLVVVPAQDLLELGTAARMNTPGTDEGNWGWQTSAGVFTEELAARVRGLLTTYGRLGD